MFEHTSFRQQQFIGKVKFLELDQSEHVSRRVIVATHQNVLAMLNARNAQIGMLYQYAHIMLLYNQPTTFIKGLWTISCISFYVCCIAAIMLVFDVCNMNIVINIVIETLVSSLCQGLKLRTCIVFCSAGSIPGFVRDRSIPEFCSILDTYVVIKSNFHNEHSSQ